MRIVETCSPWQCWRGRQHRWWWASPRRRFRNWRSQYVRWPSRREHLDKEKDDVSVPVVCKGSGWTLPTCHNPDEKNGNNGTEDLGPESGWSDMFSRRAFSELFKMEKVFKIRIITVNVTAPKNNKKEQNNFPLPACANRNSSFGWEAWRPCTARIRRSWMRQNLNIGNRDHYLIISSDSWDQIKRKRKKALQYP
jgi:hypothetical protein